MNDDFLRYKIRFLTIALLLGYVFIHTMLTGVYVEVDLPKQFDFSTRLPFGQRVLVPALAHFMSLIAPVKIKYLFFLLEWMFVSFFYFALAQLLEEEFNQKQAQLLSWLFLLLLPLMTVVNYRYTLGGTADFFYPYDTASLFFLAFGFLLCLRAQWFYLIPWIFLATFNRESSILLVLLIPALHWKKPRIFVYPMLFAFLAYILARYIILNLLLKGVPGPLMEYRSLLSVHTYLEINLYWLLNLHNLFLFLFCFAGLPVFWFAFYDYIPLRYRALRYVTLFYFLGLLLVGNFMEARLFSEIAVLLYLPVCVALSRWLMDYQAYDPSPKGIGSLIERYFVLEVLAFIALFRYPLILCWPWLLHHFNLYD